MLKVEVFRYGLDDHVGLGEVSLPQITLVGQRDYSGANGVHLPREGSATRHVEAETRLLLGKGVYTIGTLCVLRPPATHPEAADHTPA